MSRAAGARGSEVALETSIETPFDLEPGCLPRAASRFSSAPIAMAVSEPTAPLADDLARYREQVAGDPDHLVTPALGRPDRRLRQPDLSRAFLNLNNWRNRIWADACEAAGVRAVPYDLRHSYASLLFHEGQGIREVMLAMGHDSPTTERHYLHIYEEARLAPRVSLVDAVAAARASVAGTTTGPMRDREVRTESIRTDSEDENPLA